MRSRRASIFNDFDFQRFKRALEGKDPSAWASYFSDGDGRAAFVTVSLGGSRIIVMLYTANGKIERQIVVEAWD